MFRSLLLGGAAALTGLTLAVTGCSTTLTVDESTVEQTIQTRLGEQINGTVESVDCPEDLKGEIGQTMQCTMVVDGQEHKVDVNVTSIEGTTVNFNMRVVE
ncbi:DUF4333 domain-containing protein [Granulicoccus sp. GXG6511]|uniref:DUF4333 domain-containing protein n=1 Tax=Granulicoccus sp. GXG6511 TaxID=3381351 RepID=UPI003D7E199A